MERKRLDQSRKIEVSTLNGFHVPDKEERAAVIAWLKRERRSNILFPWICVSIVFVAATILTIVGILRNESGAYVSASLIVLLLSPSAMFCIKNTLTENEKVKRLSDGDALIAEAKVLDCGVKRISPHAYLKCVETEYYDEGKMMFQTIVVSKRISRKVKPGDRGFVIKYSASENKWLNKTLVFVPK